MMFCLLLDQVSTVAYIQNLLCTWAKHTHAGPEVLVSAARFGEIPWYIKSDSPLVNMHSTSF